MELIIIFSSLLLVVASFSGNEIVVVNCGVLEVVVASTLRRQFMMPISIFNINHLWPLRYHWFCIIAYTEYRFNRVGWCFLVTAIASFCSY